ncbi:hypothetical protein QEN19_002553 [Hanseniaspora menglaensis]
MSAESDLKQEVKENEQYIATLLAKNDQQIDRLRYMEEFSSTQSMIIEGLKKKVVKYTKLYSDIKSKIDILEEENKRNMEEVWQLRGDNELLKQKFELQKEKHENDLIHPDSFKTLQLENNDLKVKLQQQIDSQNENVSNNSSSRDILVSEEIAALKNEINILKNQLSSQVINSGSSNIDKDEDNSFASFASPQDDTNFLISAANHPRSPINRKLRNLNSNINIHPIAASEQIVSPSKPIETKVIVENLTEIDELEKVLQKYKSRFDEEDAKKKKVQEVFTLFDIVKKRLSSELLHLDNEKEQNASEVSKLKPEPLKNKKYDQLETRVEQISRNLENLMQQKSRTSSICGSFVKTKASPTSKFQQSPNHFTKTSPKVDFNNVSLDESQVDILHRNVAETTQKRYSLDQIATDNIGSRVVSRNSSNGSSRTLKTTNSDILFSKEESNTIGLKSSTPPSTKKNYNNSLAVDANMSHCDDKRLDTLERILKENNGISVDIDEIVNRYS